MNAPLVGVVGAALLTLCLAAPSPCAAQSTDVRALLREGFAARLTQRDADALRAFEAAWAIDGRASTLAQIGLAEHALGRWVDAERHIAACLASDDPWVARNTVRLRESLAAVRVHLGTVLLEDGPPGATVALGDRSVGTLPLREPLRAAAGTVVLRVTASGHHPLVRTLNVTAGETLRESVALTPEAPMGPPLAPPAAPPPALLAPPSPATVGPRYPWAPWALLGAGGASLVAAGTLSLLRADAVDQLRGLCSATDIGSTAAVECAPDLGARDLHARAAMHRDLSWVAAGVGAAAAIAGFIWWIASPSRRPPPLHPTSRGAGLAWSF